MGIFSASSLSLNNINTVNEIFTVDDLVDNSVGRSFTIEAVQYITESNKEYNEIKEKLYRTITESAGDDYVIHEGFSDFFAGVKKIIDKFLAFIKSLFDRFIIGLNKLVKSDKFLEKNKDKFKDFDNNKHKFDFEGYKFTTDDIPQIHAYNDYIDDLEADSEIIGKIIEHLSKDNNVTELIDDLSALVANLKDKLDSDWYDDFRGKVIGSEESISDNDFSNELFAAFRNGESDSEAIEVTKTYVDTIYTEFSNYKKKKENIEKTKRKVEQEYDKIKKSVDKFTKTKTSKDPINDITTAFNTAKFGDIRSLSGEKADLVMNQLEKYMNTKSDQVQTMSNIHALAFASKLDAVKDQYIQNKNVLYKALSKIKSIVKEDTQINITINDSDVKIKLDDEECKKPSVSVSVLPDKLDNSEDDIEITPFADDNDDAPEIPTGAEDIDNDELEDAVRSLNAIETEDIEEAVNYAINTRRPSMLVNIKSAKDPNFGRSILESMLNNKVKYSNMETLTADEIAVSSNLEYTQYKLLDMVDQDQINETTNLIESYKMYLDAINEKRNMINRSVGGYTDYTLEMALGVAKLHRDINNIDHTRFIKECLLFGSNKPSDVVMKELAILEADDNSSKKNVFERFKDFIKKIWNKFVERVTYFVSNNKKYLDKYKDIILKKIPDLDITMKYYDKGVKELTSNPIPLFNVNDAKDMESEEAYQSKLMGSKGFKSGGDFSDFCVNLFTGGPDEKEQDSKKINMSDVFDYCYSYESKIKVALEKDNNNILKSAEEASKIINRYEDDIARKAKQEEKEQAPEPVTRQPENVSASAVFSTYYDKYLLEAPSFTRNTDSKNSSSTSNSSNNGGVSNNLNSTSGEKSGEEDINNKDSDELTSLKKAIEVYNTVAGEFMAAKIKAAEEIYNSYMKLIQAHVQNEIDKNKTGTNRPVQTKTNYSNDNNEKKEENKEGKEDNGKKPTFFERLKNNKK